MTATVRWYLLSKPYFNPATVSAKTPEPAAEAEPEQVTPTRRTRRSESSESGLGMSPSDCTAFHCKNVPPALNKKEVMEKHFGRFGKVRRVFCRPHKNLAIIHFQDHVSMGGVEILSLFVQICFRQIFLFSFF